MFFHFPSHAHPESERFWLALTYRPWQLIIITYLRLCRTTTQHQTIVIAIKLTASEFEPETFLEINLCFSALTLSPHGSSSRPGTFPKLLPEAVHLPHLANPMEGITNLAFSQPAWTSTIPPSQGQPGNHLRTLELGILLGCPPKPQGNINTSKNFLTTFHVQCKLTKRHSRHYVIHNFGFQNALICLI